MAGDQHFIYEDWMQISRMTTCSVVLCSPTNLTISQYWICTNI